MPDRALSFEAPKRECSANVNFRKMLGAGLLGTILLNTGVVAGENTNHTAAADSHRIPESTIPVTVRKGFIVVVSGQIGRQTRNFIVDTGTAPSILNTRLAKKMGLQVTESRLVAAGKLVNAGQVIVPDLELGPIHARGLSMNVMDLSQWEDNLGMDIAGLLGMDILARTSFRLDYERRELSFGPVDAEGIAVGYDGTTGLALADATVQGKHVRLIVDTGSDLLVVYGETWGQSPKQMSASQEAKSVADQVGVRAILKPQVELGGRRFQGLPTYVVPSAESRAYDGFVGVRALKLRGISFDRENQTMYLLN
jgi:predicted aspartyl protease